MIPEGALLDAKNCIITPSGIKRIPSYLRFDSGTITDDQMYSPLSDLFVFWRTDGTRYTTLIDKKFVYTVNSVGDFTRYTWDFTVATDITVSGTGVTAAEDVHWDEVANEVQAGDVLVYDTAGTKKFGVIAAVNNGESITLETSPGDYGPGADWAIRRAFSASSPYLVDWTIIPDNDDSDDSIVVFADGSRYLYSFDGATFTDHAADNAYIPVCCCFFNSRLWIANIGDGTGTCPPPTILACLFISSA